MDKGHWKDPLPFRLSLDVPNPPLLVLFPCDDDHLSLDERKLIIVVCLAVVNGLHAPHFIFPRVDFSGQWYRRLWQSGRDEVIGVFGGLLLDGVLGLHIWGEIYWVRLLCDLRRLGRDISRLGLCQQVS